MYGRKYIEAFKGDIVEMFNAGCRDKSFRMGAGRMLERIKRQNPGRLDLPSETEIRQAISALMAKMKSGKAITLSNLRGIAMPYLATVVRIFVEREGNVTPRDACYAHPKCGIKHKNIKYELNLLLIVSIMRNLC